MGFLSTFVPKQSEAELKRREEEERAQMELEERERFHARLRLQRLESEADSKWLQQEELNIQLPFSPPPVCYLLLWLSVLFSLISNFYSQNLLP